MDYSLAGRVAPRASARVHATWSPVCPSSQRPGDTLEPREEIYRVAHLRIRGKTPSAFGSSSGQTKTSSARSISGRVFDILRVKWRKC
jgi:hypothetical protein